MFCEKKLIIIILAWVLLSIYFGLEYFAYKKLGRNATLNILTSFGYDWSFGLIVGTASIFSMIFSFFIMNFFFKRHFEFDFELIIWTLLNYLLCTCMLNIWGKRYLKKIGIGPNAYVGFKGFLRKCKENIEIEKEKRKKNLQ